MASPIAAILKRFTRSFYTFASAAATQILLSLHENDDTDEAEEKTDRVLQSLFATSVLADATKKAIKEAYEKAIGSTIPVFPSDLSKAWDESGMTLSQKLHGEEKEMRDAIVSTIKTQLKQNKHAMHAARALYDGYNSGEAVIRRQQMPKYLQDVIDFAHRSDLSNTDKQVLLRKVRNARRQVARLAQNGAQNKALKTAYSELLDAVESGSEHALTRSVHTAIEEKSRYVAERITRTEAARAWADGFMERYADDDDVVAFRWELSSRHPEQDICDLYAHANLYGLGKGIYPKDKTPRLPVHPHCLCHLVPVHAGELKGTQRNLLKSGGERYIDSLSKSQQLKLLGVNGYMQYKKGIDWRDLAKNYSPEVLKSRSESGIIKAKIKATGIKCQAIHFPSKPVNVDKLVFDRKHINIERKHGVTEDMARQMISKALVSLQRWNGRCEIYCSLDGWVYVVDGETIRTVFTPDEYDNIAKKLQEVLNDYEGKMPDN